MISSPISSIHHKGHTKYVTIKLTGTLNNTTLSPPYYFPLMSRVMEKSGSSRQVPITLLQVPVNGLTFGTTVSFLLRLVQSQGFRSTRGPFDCPGTWSLLRIKYSRGLRLMLGYRHHLLHVRIDLPGPHTYETSYLSPFFCFSFFFSASHFSVVCVKNWFLIDLDNV